MTPNSTEEVEDIICSFCLNKALGPNNVPMKYLKISKKNCKTTTHFDRTLYLVFGYSLIKDSTIGIRHVRMYAYFYWHTHDFGHAYADVRSFFPNDFSKFSKFFWFL